MIFRFLSLGLVASVWAQPLPNFIVILADDQGYADLGVYGSGTAPAGDPWKAWDRLPIRTPRIDKMAAEGMRFTSFYSGYPSCSSTRAAFMTGAYPARIGFSAVLFPRDSTGLNPNEITVAEMLKARGYATGAFGKWHLGHRDRYLPTRNGFDEYLGLPYSNDMRVDPNMPFSDSMVWRDGWTKEKLLALRGLPDSTLNRQLSHKMALVRGTQLAEFPVDQSTLTRRYTDEAIRFMRTNRAKPFFLYLPHSMPHIPMAASADFKGKSARGLYGDVIEEIDWNVGRLLDSLKAFGLESNTLVVYTSDNGPWLVQNANGGTAYPLRDGKGTNWEGGMRVPCIARWPGKVPAGSVQNGIAGIIDLFPTFARLSGGGLPRNRAYDGKDIWPLLEGRPGAKTPHEAFYYELTAVRSGPWKLRSGKLYNLDQDIHEDKDLAAATPANIAKVAELQKLLNDFKAELNQNKRPVGTLATQILKAGCTDPKAANYTVGAQLDDGSCKSVVAVMTRPHLRRTRMGTVRVDGKVLP